MSTSAANLRASYLHGFKSTSIVEDSQCKLTKKRGRPILSTMDARGAILRERREQLGWKMEQAAAVAGVNVGTISRMEAGKVPNASFDTWIKVCEALGLSVADLANPPTRVLESA